MTLMGDPELPIYTQPPKALTVSHTAFVYGRDKLTVSVYHQELAKTDCTVTVCQMSETDSTDKRFFRLVGATEGHYTFNTSDARDGDIYVTVTAKNFVPYTGRVVKVSQPVSPWKYRTNGFVYDLVVRGDSDSSIYAASGDTKLYALSPTMGLIWMRDLDGIVQDLDAAKDGSVLVGLRSNVSQNLLLFDKNGNRLHSWNVADEVFCIAYDPHRNTACAGLSNLNSRNSSLRTYDTSTGALRWTRNDLGSCRHVGLDSSGNIYACVTKDNPKIVKLSSDTGGTIWSYDIGASWEWESLALLVEPSGICYVSTRNHELHKVDSTGSQVWKKTGGADPNNISTAVHSLVKSGTRLYAGAGDGIIHAIEPDGTIVWKCDTGDRVDCLDVGRNDTVYAGCWHGICAISSAGTSLWFREVTGGVLSLVRVNDKLFGGSRDGWVYQVDVDESIRLSDLVVDDDVVRLHGLVISGGATHMMEFADLKKVLGVKLQTKTSEK